MVSKRLAKLIGYLPRGMVTRIARFLINGYISKYAHITVVNGERLKKIDKTVIFISNHLSNSDGLVLNRVLKSHDPWFVAGVKLSKNEVTSLGLSIVKTISINPSSADRAAISSVLNLLKSGQSICLFPEGSRSRKGSLIKAKKGILLIARMAGVPIVPVGIQGTEKLLPINDEDMGKERFNHADVKVIIGDSFQLPQREKNEDKENYEDRAMHFVMRKIAELLPPKYHGVYKEQ